MILSATEENYLKAIYSLIHQNSDRVNNQAIADKLQINPASVTDMLRKLDDKRFINYNRHEGVRLTKDGFSMASKTVRKHRLWETFLVEKMNFTWDEVHEVAEQLEHIQSDKLLNELDRLLDYPQYDPHGDPIPDANGKLPASKAKPLADIKVGKKVKVVNVADHSTSFLKYLDKQGIALNDEIQVIEVQDFDASLLVQLASKKEVFLSVEAARKILVEES